MYERIQPNEKEADETENSKEDKPSPDIQGISKAVSGLTLGENSNLVSLFERCITLPLVYIA